MNRKVKILYIVTESEWAGASRYVYDLATHLPPAEFDIVAAATGKGDMLTALQERGIRTVFLKHLPRAIRPLKDLLAFWEILFLYFRERPDIIHLNSSKAGFLGSVAAALYKLSAKILKAKSYQLKAIIFTAHGWVFNEPGRANWFFRALERFASYFRDTIICVSENDQQEAIRFRIAPAEKLVTIHNGVDPTAMRFLEREEAHTALAIYDLRFTIYESKLIGCVANLYPNKGLEYLIEAISLLKNQFSVQRSAFSVRTVIIGSGPLRSTLEARIKKYGLEDRVFLAGQIPEAWRYLKAFDCFVLASIKEGLPYAILEALAAGVPVVATSVGGIPEIAKEASLRLAPPQDPKALAGAIVEALEKQPSDQLNFPSEFTLQTMAERTREVYYHTSYHTNKDRAVIPAKAGIQACPRGSEEPESRIPGPRYAGGFGEASQVGNDRQNK